jgi:hypothetical protein
MRSLNHRSSLTVHRFLRGGPFQHPAMDLRTNFPRSMKFTLEGYVHLARMIDKCRAVLAVTASPTDEGVAQWFRKTAKPHKASELELWNDLMLTRGPSSPEKQQYFNQLRDAVDPSRTDLTAWSDLQDLEEGRSVPFRSIAKPKP